MAGEGFWESTPLQAMTQSQWESLCDGCGKCCLHKLQDAESGEVFYTRVACRLLDAETCRCADYANRRAKVADCLVLRPEATAELDWLPATCAYRLLADGQPLPPWHYLVCGDREAVHRAGQSVRGWTVSEAYVHIDEFEEHVIEWVE